MKGRLVYPLLACAVLFLAVVPLGTSVFVLGFVQGDSPCILCWAQRIGMALVTLIGLFILRYGPRPRYVGLGVLVSTYGVFMALRHSSLHVARDIGQGFAPEMLGAHTYTWSFAVFLVSLLVMAVMLMMVPPGDFEPGTPRTLGAIGRTAAVAFLVVTAGAVIQAFASTGPPPYVGQSDPVRFSFRPRYWVWSLDEYRAAPISLRGRWAVEKPDVSSVNADPAAAPLRALAPLDVVERRSLQLPLAGTPTGLDYDAGTDRFLLTTEQGVYLVDGALQTVVRHTVIDPLFSVDLGRLAAAAFLDGGTRLLAVSENKSFVALRERDGSDAVRNYRYFLESPTSFEELARSRFATVRARLQYVMSAAFDPSTNSVITISVPNGRSRRWIVSRFAAADMQLSEESVPSLDRGAFPAAQDGASALDAYYVTGAAVADGHLYALSAAHSTLLVIDLGSRAVVGAYVIPGIAQPTGLAVKAGRLYVISRDGRLAVANAPPRR